jgi:hypothetical protein
LSIEVTGIAKVVKLKRLKWASQVIGIRNRKKSHIISEDTSLERITWKKQKIGEYY